VRKKIWMRILATTWFINYATADDPPVWMHYREAKGRLPDNAGSGQGSHHPNFGYSLKDKLDKLGSDASCGTRANTPASGRPSEPPSAALRARWSTSSSGNSGCSKRP
jgi:hypothetical protein